MMDTSPDPRPLAPAATPVVVVGAGMVGTCTALALRQRGHAVCLLDRRPPGLETSFGNAGLIQCEAAEPYAFPRDLRKLRDVALGRGFDIHWHASGLSRYGAALWRYFRTSAPAAHARVVPHYAALIAQALSAHEALIALSGAQDLLRPAGYRRLYRSARALDQAARDAERVRAHWGVQSRLEDTAQLAQAEPGLMQPMAGAVHFTQTGVVADPGALVQRYAQAFERLGGQCQQAQVRQLLPQRSGWVLQTDQGRIEAAQVVIAAGPWASDLIAPLGYRLPLFVKRGYHRHFRDVGSLRGAVYDTEKGYLLLPMREGVRLTTGAELADRDDLPRLAQLQAAEACARTLVPLGEALPTPVWMGSRPCTADMLPIMGPAPRHAGLWFNFGHAHQGLTLGPIVGELLAEALGGQVPRIDLGPYSAARFGA